MSPLASKQDYLDLIEDRPHKLDESESGYREARGEPHQCRNCIHLYLRQKDGYKVCEIVRPTKGTEEIQLQYTCQFQTQDGETFPLLNA